MILLIRDHRLRPPLFLLWIRQLCNRVSIGKFGYRKSADDSLILQGLYISHQVGILRLTLLLGVGNLCKYSAGDSAGYSGRAII